MTAEGESFTTMLDEARKLPDEQIQAQAQESTRSRHRCRACFPCACLEVVYERRKRQIEAYRNKAGHLRTRPTSVGKKGTAP